MFISHQNEQTEKEDGEKQLLTVTKQLLMVTNQQNQITENKRVQNSNRVALPVQGLLKTKSD